MFWHNFKYQLKIILRERGLVFWTLAFPLILATLFSLAFSNLENSESLQLIKLAIVDNTAWQEDTVFRGAFTELSSADSENQLFEVTYVTDVATAEEMLRAEEIAGILTLERRAEFPQLAGPEFQPKITALKSNIDVTVLRTVVTQISEQSQVIQDISAEAPGLLAKLAKVERANLENNSSENLSYTVIEYYSLLAMTCLYGGMLSMSVVNRLLANMSTSGRRIAVSPVPKSRLLGGGLLAGYAVQLFGLALLFAYTILVLNVDYGEKTPLVILLAFIGSLAGLALGAMLASAFRMSENAKVGLTIAVTMFGCFLAGMMGITMKYLVDTNLPLLNQVNPANLITDGLYSLYYYSTLARFWRNMVTLLVITFIMLGVSVFSLRKEQYDTL